MQDKNKQITALNHVLELTDSVVNKTYLSFLTNSSTYKLCNLGMNTLAVNIAKHARIYHLRKFVYDANENFLQKLITVVNVAYSLKGSILTAIHSQGDVVDFYIGIVAKEKKGAAGEKDREALLNAFAGTIAGNFNGSQIGDPLREKELEIFEESINGNAICSVSAVPSLRNGSNEEIISYVQGLENLVDALRGKTYTLLTIADPISPAELMEIRHGYEHIYHYLFPLYRVVETKGSSEMITLSSSDTENYVKGITEGLSRTQGSSDSVNYANGFNLGISLVLSAGFNHSKTYGETNSRSVTNSHQMTEQTGYGYSQSRSLGYTTSGSTQISSENRMIKSMLDKIEKNIQRIDECEGYGAFHSATYVLADDRETALQAAGNFASLVKGERSSVQSSAIHCWERNGGNGRYFSTLLSYLQHLSHPVFSLNDQLSVSTCTMVSGLELTVQMAFPKKSVYGLTVLPMHPFGRNVIEQKGTSIRLGQLLFMGQKEHASVKLNVNSLAAHTLIIGATGTGKSNAVCQLLSALGEQQISFMVVEPAKGEYKDSLGSREDVAVFGTNEKKTDLLKINPFSFHPDVHVLEHIDRLIEIFNVCWPMYAAMPVVLKEALEEAYLACGWNLDSSENRYGILLFPSFFDLQKALQRVIGRSAYDEEVKSNYKGSLLTRVNSLANGLNGKIFSSEEIESEELFDRNVIVDLSRVGSAETKALIMGLLVMKLEEYRMAQGGGNQPLKHVMVLEEAHHLLKRTTSGQNPEGSNVSGKSVEMLAASIAQMRTYGQGFIIADQSPGLLDLSVIRNTNTKILLRTPEYEDRLLAGRSAGLNEGQIEELASLPLGVAAVYQNNWLEPVLCQFDCFLPGKPYVYQKRETEKEQAEKHVKMEFLKWMLAERVQEYLAFDIGQLEMGLDKLLISAQSKLLLRKFIKEQKETPQSNPWKRVKFSVLAELVTEILGCAKDLAYVCSMEYSVNELQESLSGLLAYCLEGSCSETMALEIEHCLMKTYSAAGREALEQYYLWDHQIRSKSAAK